MLPPRRGQHSRAMARSGGRTDRASHSEAVQDYVDQVRVPQRGAGHHDPPQFARGQEVDTRIIKKVVQAAGEAGVNEVIFGSLSVDN